MAKEEDGMPGASETEESGAVGLGAYCVRPGGGVAGVGGARMLEPSRAGSMAPEEVGRGEKAGITVPVGMSGVLVGTVKEGSDWGAEVSSSSMLPCMRYASRSATDFGSLTRWWLRVLSLFMFTTPAHACGGERDRERDRQTDRERERDKTERERRAVKLAQKDTARSRLSAQSILRGGVRGRGGGGARLRDRKRKKERQKE